MTRCGAPSILVVTSVPVTAVPRYAFLTSSGTAESEVSRNRVPMAMPEAP